MASLLITASFVAGLLTAAPAASAPSRPPIPQPTPVASTPSRPPIPQPTPAVSLPRPRPGPLVGMTMDTSLYGMHVIDIQNPAAWPTIAFGGIRLWDTSTSWADLEKSPGVFKWDALDQAVSVAEGFGKKDILMVLGGTPAWASADPSPNALPYPGAAGMPTNLAWWDEWVTNVATRYKGRISSYQVWNEANLSTFSTMTPAQMADLTKRAYDIIKGIDPAALVVAPSTGTRLTSAFNKFYPPFLTELAARGWPVDVFAAHTYPASLGTPTDRAALVKMWLLALHAAGAPARPLWDTEINFGLAGPGPLNPDQDIVGAQAASWTVRMYLDSLRYGISRTYWYSWMPESELLGIQMNTGSPAAKAQMFLNDTIISSVFNGCSQKLALVTCLFTKPVVGKQWWVWSEGLQTKVAVPAGVTHLCQVDGNCVKLAASYIRVRNNPVLLRGTMYGDPP